MRRSKKTQVFDYFDSRTDAVEYLKHRGWIASVNDHFHFRHPEFTSTRRVLKSKHNEWFISIVS